MVVIVLSGGCVWPWRYHYKLEKAAYLLQHSRVSIRHIYRECNAVTDSLAKLAMSTRRTQSFRMQDISRYIKSLVELDKH